MLFSTFTRAKYVLKWNAAVIFGLAALSMLFSSLDRIQHRMGGLVGDELFVSLQSLSHCRNVASLSLFYRYFQGECSEELIALVPQKREFSIPT